MKAIPLLNLKVQESVVMLPGLRCSCVMLNRSNMFIYTQTHSYIMAANTRENITAYSRT